jgi:hypothetical protein
MSRRWTGRPDRDWPESVVILSDEDSLADRQALHLSARFGPPARQPRVVPGWLVAAALLLACSATAAALLWWQHRSRTILVTNRVQPSYAAGADASGCPHLIRCRVQADVGQPLGTTARQVFGDATVLSSLSVIRSDTGQTVQTSIVLRTRSGIEVWATAQCLPGGAAIPGRASALPASGPAQADVVVGGEPGCSVAVSAQIPRSVPVPAAELRRLASDPGVQLSP